MSGTRTSFAGRVIGAAALDTGTYEEVEADAAATAQAVAVVLLASVAAGLGASGGGSIAGVVARSVVALLSWGAWAAIVTQVGGRLLPEPQTRVNTAELLRTLGFAAAPGVIQVLGVIGPLSRPVLVIAWLWMLAAMVVAVRQALDYRQTSRAIVVCLVGGVVAVGLTVALGLLLSTPVS
jgi:hypothetical protein